MKSVILLLVLLTASLALPGCGKPISEKGGACNRLDYREGGLTREEYLPCVGEILALMDELRPHVEASLDGDKESRKLARRTYRKLRKLVKKAGGKSLLEEWEDQRLSDLNTDLFNAYLSYWACTRSPNQQDFQNAEQNHDDARGLYDLLT